MIINTITYAYIRDLYAIIYVHKHFPVPQLNVVIWACGQINSPKYRLGKSQMLPDLQHLEGLRIQQKLLLLLFGILKARCAKYVKRLKHHLKKKSHFDLAHEL